MLVGCTAAFFFSGGAAAYAMQWPNYEWHRHKFQAHELFHLGTVCGFACIYTIMYSLTRRLPLPVKV